MRRNNEAAWFSGWFQRPQQLVGFILTHIIGRCLFLIISVLFYCEYLHYFVVILQCSWPQGHIGQSVNSTADTPQPVQAMILADTHLLGSREGHWFDKLRREWQMQRSFQTSVFLHRPQVVFLLGDVFDEGKWCSSEEFQYHVSRFKKMFAIPYDMKLYVVVGNHDVGFHYMMTRVKLKRFEKAFSSPSVQLLEIEDNIFILLNSMAMEGDGCSMCQDAVDKLQQISVQLQCSQGLLHGKQCKDVHLLPNVRPILLQHFPLYRPSDGNCSLSDSASADQKNIPFHEKYDCLSAEATKMVLDLLNPRLIMSGHTHHGCLHYHGNSTPEWSVSSFSWRYKKIPGFMMAMISKDAFEISQCHLPDENTVISIYICGAMLILLSFILPFLVHLKKNLSFKATKSKGE